MTFFRYRKVTPGDLVNHLFLPKRLPQSEEEDLPEIELTLLEYILELISERFLHKNSLPRTERTLKTWRALQDAPDPHDLRRTLEQLDADERDSVCLYVRKQNCVIHFTKLDEEHMRVITFRASLPNENVTGACGSLKVTYPETVDIVPISPLLLSSTFSEQLSHLTFNVYPMAMPMKIPASKNEDQSQLEVTEPSHPYMVSDFLVGMLCPMDADHFGDEGNHEKIKFQKKIRDQVNWKEGEGGLPPFRRSGLWTSAKVILQLSLQEEMRNKEEACVLYKIITLEVLVSLALEYEKDKGAWDIIAHTMTKLARRAKKLSEMQKIGWSTNANLNLQISETLKRAWSTIDKIHTLVSKQWSVAVNSTIKWNEITKIQRTSSQWNDDCVHNLEKLTNYLNQAAIPAGKLEEIYNLTMIDPIEQTATVTLEALLERQEELETGKKKSLEDDHVNEKNIWIYHVEWFVRNKLTVNSPCGDIYKLLKSYFQTACHLYGITYSDPVAYSRLTITILKMVQVLDEIAVKKHPLLTNYKPGIRSTFFDRLLVPEKCDMKLVKQLQKYFFDRDSEATSEDSWIQNSEVDPDDFCVQYAKENEKMQDLKKQLLDRMEKDIERKEKEVKTVRESCKELERKISANSCSYTSSYYAKEKVHDDTCVRCKWSRELAKTRVSVFCYKRPLPLEEFLRDAVIFELLIPEEIAVLRDSSVLLLEDVLALNVFSPEVQIRQKWTNIIGNEMRFLKEIATGHQSLCHLATEKRDRTFNAGRTKPDVMKSSAAAFVVENGLSCKYARINAPEKTPKMPFTFRISDAASEDAESYQNLQFALDRNRPTENEVLAKQHKCHQNLNLPDFKTFGALRCGDKIQIRNLYIDITAGIPLENEPVLQLIMQTLWELGSGSGKKNVNIHEDFELETSSDFAMAFLDLLDTRQDKNGENWSNPMVFLSHTVIAVRILEINESLEVKEAASKILQKYRSVSETWCVKLEELLVKAPDQENTKLLQDLLLKCAICCVFTFNASSPENIEYLFRNPSDVTYFLKALSRLHHLVMRENILSENPPSSFTRNMLRHARLTIPLNLQEHLHSVLSQSRVNRVLHNFVCSKWFPGQQLCGDNVPVFKTSEHEDVNKKHVYHAVYTISSISHKVSVDTIRGTFFVDGYPPSVLPEKIIRNPLYKSYFRASQFRVQRDSQTFRTTDKYYGHHFEFTQVGDRVIIRQLAQDGSWLELLPRELLDERDKQLNTDLIANYTHWFDSKAKVVHFRRISSTEEPEENIEDDTDYLLVSVRPTALTLLKKWYLGKYNGSRDISTFLLSAASDGFKQIVKKLSRLDSKNFAHVFWEKSEERISVNLWRFNLTFSLRRDSGLLYCANYPDYYIPFSKGTGHNLGTLVGLKSGIVMEKHTAGEPGGTKKIFLVPHGRVQIPPTDEWTSRHQSVEITELRNPKYFMFEVDQILKRLRPGNNKAAWLYLALLHGVTSSPFPDPFTQLTGVEMAMWILQSGFPWSCSPYDITCRDTLEQISNLSPRYAYYPNSNSKMMEGVEWPDNLPQNSYAAYDGYAIIVQKLLQDSFRVTGLFSGEKLFKGISKDLELHKRSYYRNINMYNKAAHLSSEFIKYLVDCSTELTPCSLSSRKSPDDPDHLTTLAQHRLYGTLSSNAETVESLIMAKDPISSTISTDQLTDGNLSTWLNTRVRESWLQLYFLARKTGDGDLRHKLTFILGAMMYAGKGSLDQILNLHNISVSHRHLSSSSIPVPPVSLTAGNYEPLDHKFVSSVISTTLKQGATAPPTRGDFENSEDFNEARNIYNNKLQKDSTAAAEILKEEWNSWPRPDFAIPVLKRALAGKKRLILSSDLLDNVNAVVRSWYDNFSLTQFLADVDGLLREVETYVMDTQQVQENRPNEAKLCFEAVPYVIDKWFLDEDVLGGEPGEADFVAATKAITISSTGHLQSEESRTLPLAQQRMRCMVLIKNITDQFENHFFKNDPANVGLSKAGLSVRLAPVTMLRDHISQPINSLQNGSCFVGALAVAMAHLKRLNRLTKYNSDTQKYSVELERERETEECENWNPLDYPEWLLLELELDITIRSIQVEVAKTMIEMPNKENGVMQLNMGEGKTSVIMPMILATLSKSKDYLCRLTVLNSIYTTNYNLLAFTIGGFLNKRLYTVPCSRDIDIGKHLSEIDNIYKECLRLGGTVITLPEHRLSFRLQMYNSFLQGKNEVGQKIGEIESWLRTHVRDLVDESDEIFNVKYQLIYTTGKQRQMDGGSMRWTVCQKLLELLPQVATKLFLKHGTCIEFQPGNSSSHPEIFSHFRILSDECKNDFYELVADALLDGKVNLIGLVLRGEERNIVKDFLTKEDISKQDHDKLFKIDGISEEKKQILMLVSGYLRRGILLAALNKRWRVEYGVKPSKQKTSGKLMAVPFRAKDVAAERTEFGHPDMAIVLTQLSYYYSGLTDAQLRKCFDILDKAITGPEAVYDSWIKKIPPSKIESESVKSYKGINLQDYEQRTKHLFPLLRKHKAVVDFWLENVVFPKECKQFPFKLTTNAWDLCYERNKHATTGFSGTNDTSLLLPAKITQQDLEVLSETNAQMEEILQREENQWKRSLTVADSCKDVIQFMIQDGLRVLIDAGALMLELGNDAIADLWLELDKNLEAVVYFSRNGEMVIKLRRPTAFRKHAKKETDQPFNLSPLKERLENCAIYIDDQHTRGTDINLPIDFKACVTIGSGMRRDKLIQSCMRMRKLGKGQSVHFYLSHEVHNKITNHIDPQASITVNDIINWTKSNSSQFEKDGLVYWALNARNYAKNLAADDLYENSGKLAAEGKILAERCEDPDAQDLERMYRTYHHQSLLVEQIPEWFSRKILSKLFASILPVCSTLRTSVDETLQDIRQTVEEKCQKHIPEKTFYHSVLEEEQEKELEPEQEVEEQKYRPPEETPAAPELHRNVKRCVTTMNEVHVMDGILSLNEIFNETTIARCIQAKGWGNQFFATNDFIKVIQNDVKRRNDLDSYTRSIRYFVSFKNGTFTSILLLSLHEANGLISFLREGKCSSGTTLHMFSGRRMDGQPIFANDPRLQLPVRPAMEAISLDENIMAPLLIASGNLYFSSMEEQRAFARFLGLRLRPWTEEEEKAFQEKQITNSGFVLPSLPALREGCRFMKDPTNMVMRILKLRNDVLRDSNHTVCILESCAYVVLNNDEEMTEVCHVPFAE